VINLRFLGELGDDFMRKTHILTAFLAVSLCFLSCSQEPPTVTFIQLEEDLELSLWQELSPSGAQVQILLKTTDLYDCEDAKIISQYTQINTSIDLLLESIEYPENCNSNTLNYISKTHPLQLENGVYDFTARFTNVIANEGKLRYSDDNIELVFNTTNGLKQINPKLNRIHNNTAWGYIKDNTADKILTSDLMEIIEHDPDLEILPGNYGHFNVLENGKATIHQPEGDEEGFIVRYKDTLDWQNLTTKADEIHMLFDVEIYLQNFDGEFYRS